MILFEDIDCMKAGNRRSEAEEERIKQEATNGNQRNDATEGFSVTLSGLLNVLDSFHAPENVVFVMTTNKVEELDPALLRPGHIDCRLFMGELSNHRRSSCTAGSFSGNRDRSARLCSGACGRDHGRSASRVGARRRAVRPCAAPRNCGVT